MRAKVLLLLRLIFLLILSLATIRVCGRITLALPCSTYHKLTYDTLMHTSFSLLATARQASGLFINNNRNRCYMHTLLLTYIHTIANLSLTLTYFFSSLSTLFLNLHVLFLQVVEEDERGGELP